MERPISAGAAGHTWYGTCANCGGICRVSENLCDHCRWKKRLWTGIIIGLVTILILVGVLAAVLFAGVADGSEEPQAPAAATAQVEDTQQDALSSVEKLVQ